MSFVATWLAAGIKADAVARLRALPTLAGLNVEADRVSPVPQTDLPFVAVMTPSQENTLEAEAGSEPRYKASLTLMIDATVQASPVAVATAQLDQLTGQILDGLLSDPVWIAKFDQVSGVHVQQAFKGEGGSFTGFARISLTLLYVERYPPRAGAPFHGVDLTEHFGDQTVQATLTVPGAGP